MNLCKYIYTYLNVSSFNDLKTYVNTFAKHNVCKKNDEKFNIYYSSCHFCILIDCSLQNSDDFIKRLCDYLITYEFLRLFKLNLFY